MTDFEKALARLTDRDYTPSWEDREVVAKAATDLLARLKAIVAENRGYRCIGCNYRSGHDADCPLVAAETLIRQLE